MAIRVSTAVSGTLRSVAGLSFLVVAMDAQTPSDPGVRGGAAGAGRPIGGLSVRERIQFEAGKDEFTEVQSVTRTIRRTVRLPLSMGWHRRKSRTF